MYLRKGDADFWLRSCLQCPVFIVRIELGITKSLTTKRCNHHRATFCIRLQNYKVFGY